MKVLVTGSEGFIGRYIVNELVSRSYQVIGVDNFSKYGKSEVIHHKNYTFINLDVRDTEKLKIYLQDCDHLIAGAALIGGISYFHEYPFDILSQNEQIIAATCEAALYANRLNKLKKITFISSSMVYENVTTWPTKEGEQLKNPPPFSAYGFQKLSMEYFAKALWDQYEVPYTILRPFNCIGIGERKSIKDSKINSGEIKLNMSHVVPDLCQKILKNQFPVKILGNGNQIRCYTYGGDLARGIVDSLENNESTNQDFNLSTDEITTVKDLVEKIWTKINGNRKLELEYETPLKYDVQKRIPDCSKAKKILNFKATKTLDGCLDEIIPWVSNAIKMNYL